MVGDEIYTSLGMATVLAPVRFDDQNAVLAATTYKANGGFCLLGVVENEPGPMKLSTNIMDELPGNEFVLSHDFNMYKETLLNSGVIVDTGRRVNYSNVRQQPIYRVPGWPE